MSPDARRQAALELVARHDAALRRTARRHSLCAADADDAYQRALLIALRKAPDVGPAPLSRWMHTVVRNEAHAVRRARQRLFALAGEPVPTPAFDPHERAELGERVDLAARALSTLKPQERRAIGLRAAGLSYAEIGELCGWTYTKVNRLLSEGRASLSDRVERLEAMSAS